MRRKEGRLGGEKEGGVEGEWGEGGRRKHSLLPHTTVMAPPPPHSWSCYTRITDERERMETKMYVLCRIVVSKNQAR